MTMPKLDERRAGRTARRLLLARGLLVCALVLGGCGGGDGGTSCPPGYLPTADGCLPPLRQDISHPNGDGSGPADTSAETDTGLPADAADTAPGDRIGAPDEDVPPSIDIPEPAGRVGDPCRRDDQCDFGLECLGWPGGYCTLYYCDRPGADCPADSVCLPLVDNAAACFRVCDGEGATLCRPDDPSYACKPLADANDQPVTVCHPTTMDARGNGAACDDHAGCAGELACLRSLPGGACLRLFCDSDIDCATPGSVCARFDGLPTCLVGCTTDGDCLGVGDGSLGCGEIRNLAGHTVRACLSSTAALPVGAACLSDAECASALCETLGQGRCTTGEPRQPCDNTGQCPGAAFCEFLPAPINACSAACGGTASQQCEEGGCVVGRDGSAACRPSCEWDAGHTAHDCRDDGGWVCVYGIPRRDEAARGYYCAGLAPGDAGSECEEDRDCGAVGATCLKADGAGERDPGYCTQGCSPQQPCPFGTYCLSRSGLPRCLRVCFTDLDCPAGLACRIETASSAVHKICTAP